MFSQDISLTMALLSYYSYVSAYPNAFSFFDQESQQYETNSYYKLL